MLCALWNTWFLLVTEDSQNLLWGFMAAGVAFILSGCKWLKEKKPGERKGKLVAMVFCIAFFEVAAIAALVADVAGYTPHSRIIIQALRPKEARSEAGQPYCPRCGTEMEAKTRHKDGKRFWGCPRYREGWCRGTRELTARDEWLLDQRETTNP